MASLLLKARHIFALLSALLVIIIATPSPAIRDVNFVPDSLTFLSSDYAVVIDKTMQKLFVFQSEEGEPGIVFQARCSTGKNSGKKMKMGDARTPEGIYFPTRKYGDKELSSIYGTMAFHLDYPNMIDVRAGRNGNNIWIHGTNKPLQDFQSNGCITLENRDIEALSHYIALHETPVIIYDYIKWVPQEIHTTFRKQLKGTLDRWIDAAGRGDRSALTSLYAPVPPVKKKSTDVLVGQTGTWRAQGMTVSLLAKDISLLKYGDYAVILFDQVLSLGSVSGSGGRRMLMLTKNPGSWRIIGDRLQSLQTEAQFSKTLSALNESFQTMRASADKSHIASLIRNWSESWASGDMVRYRSFYAPDFTAAKRDLDGWIAYKTRLSKINKHITIEIDNVEITVVKNRSVAVFKQRYNSSRYNAYGIKRLHLIKINDRWMIHKEFWKAIRG